MEIIKTENLSFSYPDESKKALDDISIAVNSGEFVTICGKSGCGKSTLLRQLKPILSPYGKKEGKVLFEGNDINKLSQRQQSEKIGFVLQSLDNQIVTDKVWHELAFALESLSYETKEIRALVAEMAAFFGIEDWFHKKTNELSGGQKQLLNLASVMVIKPSVLLLDEPTSQLDPIAAQEFLNALHKINRELGTTIIITEHRLEEVFSISDRVIVMDEGKVIIDAVPLEVGKFLKDTDNDMLKALPTPMRVHFSVENSEKCPVTVREGKKWLENVSSTKKINKILEEEKVTSAKASVEIDDVYFRYEKDLPDILRGLKFKVSKGEFYAIVGGNGVGKTTMLSVIGGINKPYRGNVKTYGKVAFLPQNPQLIFAKKTVIDDLVEMSNDKSKIENIIKMCNLEDNLYKHPYDLSGGEMQRAALAKVLLTNPDILLLDEPTKGFDAHFKEKFADIILNLKQNGVTVIMVSHDIEFCAEYADKCAMFFDGNIVSEGNPRSFFAGKSFYTTSANRMARAILPNAVLADDIIYALGGKVKDKKHEDICEKTAVFPEEEQKLKKKTNIKTVLGSIFLVLFTVTCIFQKSAILVFNVNIIEFLVALELLGVFVCFFGGKRERSKHVQINKKTKITKKVILSYVMVLIAVPLTMYFGICHLGDRKYYFISLLIIIETFLPFVYAFESRHPKSRELVLISVICALAVSGRMAFYMMPHFKPVMAIIIISAVCLGAESGFLIGAISAFVSNFFFGQGPWTPWQMFAYGIVGFIAGILFSSNFVKKSKIPLCIFGFLATIFVYGVIMNTQMIVATQQTLTLSAILTSCILGLKFDLIHAVSTVIFLLFIGDSVIEKLERIKTKYGL